MRSHRVLFVVAILLAGGYLWLRGGFVGLFDRSALETVSRLSDAPGEQPRSDSPRARAIFAAGCFWCVESDFDKVAGVVETISGYTGGSIENPTYSQVSAGGTGHTEAVEIVYDPSIVSYEQLLDHFWQNVDPFVSHRQFCDVGTQYRPEIFYESDEQRVAAEASRDRLQEEFGQPIVVAITPASAFYRAEAYHQDYYQKNSLQYRYYRWGCGRDARLEEIWGVN